ncbi:uncharacterized protein LOC121735542 isoform X2 [Aricia agestis]|uniref:uncharacterized protein LOC121735542 isoform X2 n=1 Tax=Aricia agestis TaxID=91739 RepID=UPI001C2076EA|nr:uncharacterized protein LOC121735542 isoform X2 [Aricia agestis]
MYIRSCASIRCYDCNSANNSMCLDPTIYDTESVQKYLRLADCEKNLVAAPRAGQNMFCRKIIQTILRKGHEPEVRVTRGCGWVKHHRACYKADNEDHLETVCQCFTDHCNAAPRHVAAVATTAALMISLMCY